MKCCTALPARSRRYSEELSGPGRPDHCLQCESPSPLRAHGFCTRTLVDIAFDGMIAVLRYLCCRGLRWRPCVSPS